MHGLIRVPLPVAIWVVALGMGCGGGGGGTNAGRGKPSPPEVPAIASPTAHQVAQVPALPMPAIQSFTATFNSLPHGAFYTLTAAFTGGTGSIDQNVGPVASGEPVSTVTIIGTTTFTLTVSNAAGAKVTEAVTVTPQVEKILFSYWWW